MARLNLTPTSWETDASRVISQGASALLFSTFDFLMKNDISERFIVDAARHFVAQKRRVRGKFKLYYSLLRQHEAMGIVMATWYSHPNFLDSHGCPVSLHGKTGQKSLSRLLRAAAVNLPYPAALKLMERSPSVRIEPDGSITPLRRVFVLPELEVPRAAFVVKNYLDTLHTNAVARRKKSTLLLERSCHVSEVDVSMIASLLRNIEDRGTAFIDSIDGDLEGHRLRRTQGKVPCELGVSVFAWTNARRSRPSKHESRQPLAPRYPRNHSRGAISDQKAKQFGLSNSSF